MAILLNGSMARASSSHSASVAAYARAEKLARHLDARPISARTRPDYERVLDAYRSVYHGDPGSPDAGRSIAAVADLLVSEGRSFHQPKFFRYAIAQWEFLRREYPGSPLRQHALFAEGQIESQDLHDRVAAKKIYRSFLAHYPHDALAQQARADLNGPSPSTARVVKARTQSTHPEPVVVAKNVEASAEKTLPSRAFPTEIQPGTTTQTASFATIKSVRYWAEGSVTRVAVDLSAAVPYHAYIAPDGQHLTLVFFGAHLAPSLTAHIVAAAHDSNLQSIRAASLTADQSELVLDLDRAAQFSSFSLTNPDRVILSIQPIKTSPPAQMLVRSVAPPSPLANSDSVAAPAPTQHGPAANRLSSTRKPIPADTIRQSAAEAPAAFPQAAAPYDVTPLASPFVDGQSSMARVLGLRVRRIVIDAGHGGHDSGTLGPDGIEEKDIALDVALRLGHLLHQRLDADVIYTRSTDKFVPLEERTAIANRAHADLFISVHANSSSDPDVRGVETYFLNFTASPDALRVAARENETSNRSVHELSDLVRKITLSDKIDESREFAGDVQQSLYSGLEAGNAGMKDRGVRQAPFAVLIGAHMPSILAEISFLTNPSDASELARSAYRERVALALYRGVATYVNGMSGVRMAKAAQPQALPAPVE